MKFGIVRFPGSCDDIDALGAAARVGSTELLWHTERDLKGVDAIIVPGGFSYGDYLRAGAIARFSPVMEAVAQFAREGGLVLGICNGFQVLCEAHLLPGAMIKNDHRAFVCREQQLSVQNVETAWTRQYTVGERITIPLKNQDGQFVADERTLDQLEAQGRVVFRYTGWNPNGSRRDIAGITNEAGNVVGLMPHPEHAVEPGFGPDGPAGPRRGTDGLRFFTSVLGTLVR